MLRKLDLLALAIGGPIMVAVAFIVTLVVESAKVWVIFFADSVDCWRLARDAAEDALRDLQNARDYVRRGE